MRQLLLLLLLSTQFTVSAQKADSTSNGHLDVFLDCSSCDEENLRQKVAHLNYVRDRLLCDVHILITEQATGSGGTAFLLQFFGRKQFENMNDEFHCDLPANSTADEQRDLLNKYIQLGLVRYMLRTPLASHLELNLDETTPDNDTVKDKWNYWVFQISGGGWLNGEKYYSNTNLYGDVTANRVKKEGKTNFEFYTNYSRNVFQISETEKVIGLYRQYWSNFRHVWSLSDHWSLGAGTTYSSSLYENLDHSIDAGPEVEYNIFPYDESSTRMLYFSYGIKPIFRDYNRTTVLFLDEQFLISHNLSFNTKFIKKWGQINSDVTWSNFLHDFNLSRLSLSLNGQFRLFKGFSLSISAYYAMIKNLINLPLEGATEEEMLLRQVQLPTSSQYWCSFGISYTFGSMYNNIVNPRLD